MAEWREERVADRWLCYLHRVSHNIQKAAARHSISVVFLAPRNLSMLPSQLNKHSKDDPSSMGSRNCAITHGIQFVQCATGVVYVIPFACGRSYIGQTGRCLNARLENHHTSLKANPSGHLTIHVRNCCCQGLFQKARILESFQDWTAREITEAFYISRRGSDSCVSAPSLTLQLDEILTLKKRQRTQMDRVWPISRRGGLWCKSMPFCVFWLYSKNSVETPHLFVEPRVLFCPVSVQFSAVVFLRMSTYMGTRRRNACKEVHTYSQRQDRMQINAPVTDIFKSDTSYTFSFNDEMLHRESKLGQYF